MSYAFAIQCRRLIGGWLQNNFDMTTVTTNIATNTRADWITNLKIPAQRSVVPNTDTNVSYAKPIGYT